MKQKEDKPLKQYDLANVKYTHDLVIKYDDRQIYRVRDQSHTMRGGTITLEQLNETVVGICKISSFGRGRKLFAGDPDTKKGVEWIDLQNSKAGFGFEFDDQACVWSQTGKNDYVLEDGVTQKVLMTFTDNSKNLQNPVPQLNIFVEMEKDLERLCLVALFSLAKRDKGSLDMMTRLAMGSAGAGILIAGGGAGA